MESGGPQNLSQMPDVPMPPSDVVGAQPPPPEPTAAEYDPWRTKRDVRRSWRTEDSLQATGLPYPERAAIAGERIRDADTLQGTDNPVEKTLRVEALGIAPDRHDPVQAHNALEAGMLLTQNVGPRSRRRLEEVSNITRLHDVLALDVFWAAREAQDELGQKAAKLMLGSLIVDSVQEILALSKVMQRSGTASDANGKLAEFMYITWERLHLYLDDDPGRIGQVFIRSASPSEDERNRDKTKSCDAVIMAFPSYVDKSEGPDRSFVQYKTGKSKHKYHPSVKVVHIPDWDAVLDHVEDVAHHFNMLVKSSSDRNEQLVSLAALGGYFATAQIEDLSRARQHAPRGKKQKRNQGKSGLAA